MMQSGSRGRLKAQGEALSTPSQSGDYCVRCVGLGMASLPRVFLVREGTTRVVSDVYRPSPLSDARALTLLRLL